jgi:acylphosphatase
MRAEATRLGLTGWVKNLYDGRVEAVIEGEGQSVQKLLAWCRQGPPSAKVTGVKVFLEKPTGEFRSFEIVY